MNIVGVPRYSAMKLSRIPLNLITDDDTISYHCYRNWQPNLLLVMVLQQQPVFQVFTQLNATLQCHNSRYKSLEHHRCNSAQFMQQTNKTIQTKKQKIQLIRGYQLSNTL